MSYQPLNPQKNLTPFVKSKPMKSYPSDVMKNIKLVSFSKTEQAIPFGSYIYRLQEYPGDVDLYELYICCSSIDELVGKFEKDLKDVVKNIISLKNHFYSEVKAGLDYRYRYNIGKLINGTFYKSQDLSQKFGELRTNNLITEEEYALFNKTINSYILSDGDKYDIIYNILRERMILRWTADEILNGEKVVTGNVVIKLNDALRAHTPIKLDMLTIINDKFVEVTNFVMIAYKQGNKIIPVNILIDNNINYDNRYNLEAGHTIEGLYDEIEKLYYSNYYYSPFKMLKRMYSVSRYFRNAYILEKIIPFISSHISLLYQLKSELDAIELVIEKYENPPTYEIDKNIELMKDKLSRIVQIDDKTLNKLLDMLISVEYKNNNITTQTRLKIIGEIKKLFKSIINFYTITYLDNTYINPPPSSVLPTTRKYDPRIIRLPNEDVKIDI